MKHAKATNSDQMDVPSSSIDRARRTVTFRLVLHSTTTRFRSLDQRESIIGLATERLRILSLDAIDKIRNRLAANRIFYF